MAKYVRKPVNSKRKEQILPEEIASMYLWHQHCTAVCQHDHHHHQRDHQVYLQGPSMTSWPTRVVWCGLTAVQRTVCTGEDIAIGFGHSTTERCISICGYFLIHIQFHLCHYSQHNICYMYITLESHP